ncbi:sirohydrochlorin chelatase, partial [Deinococcus sp. 12RED42]|uniref:sirohydrochlorin chelatase n=1 Tax=Deinococcus sp. 12RED42 TaxID=2745872 RepID=UPI00351D6670
MVCANHSIGGRMTYAVVLAAHGSRDPASSAQFEQLAALVRSLDPGRVITHGYLEFNSPT